MSEKKSIPTLIKPLLLGIILPLLLNENVQAQNFSRPSAKTTGKKVECKYSENNASEIARKCYNEILKVRPEFSKHKNLVSFGRDLVTLINLANEQGGKFNTKYQFTGFEMVLSIQVQTSDKVIATFN